ncbi:MAG: replication endonuclease [Algicola sp.]|nr:replication endonuclease [Algicola sp.]
MEIALNPAEWAEMEREKEVEKAREIEIDSEKMRATFGLKAQSICALEYLKKTKKINSVALAIIASMGPEDVIWLTNEIKKLPKSIQTRVIKTYLSKKDAGSEAKDWLKETVDKMKARFGLIFRITRALPLPWNILSNKKKTVAHAKYLAGQSTLIITQIMDSSNEIDNRHTVLTTVNEFTTSTNTIHEKIQNARLSNNFEERARAVFESVGENALKYQVKPHKWDERDRVPIGVIESALLRIQCDKWWAGKLKRIRVQYLELLEIATGQVGNGDGISAYASKMAQAEYKETRDSGRAWLEMMELENDSGDVISLTDAVKAGVSNPVNRRNECMLRIRGIEEIANGMGFVGVFYTLTCPAKYHANAAIWNGSSTKSAQAYLVKTWARVRADLAQREIPYFGLRVAEPHADGCPHWHMLLFVPTQLKHKINHIIRRHFCAEEREELIKKYKNRRAIKKKYNKRRRAWGYNKSKGLHAIEPKLDYRVSTARFKADDIDPKKGSAVSYIAKYISKNLSAENLDGDGLKNHVDAETGKPLLEQINPVLAWASVWGIRQFQFIGSPSVTVYRELRRVREEVDNPEMEAIRKAADDGDWPEFVRLMGGMCIGRKANFKTHYEITECGNQYGEDVKRVKGVADAEETQTLLSRVVDWVRQLKGTAEEKLRLTARELCEAKLSWTSGNNCNSVAASATELADRAKLFTLGFDKQEIKLLFNGSRVSLDGQQYRLDGRTLRSFDADQQRRQYHNQRIQSEAELISQLEHRDRVDAMAQRMADRAGVDDVTVEMHDEAWELLKYEDLEPSRAAYNTAREKFSEYQPLDAQASFIDEWFSDGDGLTA